MEFKSLNNIETSFKQIRVFGIVFLCVCTLITGFALWKSYAFAEAQRQKIYVLDEGKSLMLALAQDVSINRPVEAREHVNRFHDLFFTLSPDRSAIESNVEKALHLSDESAYSYYKDLKERGYYNRVIAGNIMQRFVVDSITCNFDTYPYAVTTYGKQFIIRQSNVTERSLITTCRLLNTVKSDYNPQGFMIEAFEVKENKDIRVYER